MGSSAHRVRRQINKRGRAKYVPHVRHYMHELDSAAYKSLSAHARCTLMMLKRHFNGSNNGNVYLSVRDVMIELRCGSDKARAAFGELEDRGFIRCLQRGSFHWKKGMASRWLLTEFGFGDDLPSKDFMHWRPQK